MQNAIKTEIKRLCRRIYSRQDALNKRAEEYRTKFHRRSGVAAGIPSSTTAPFFVNRHFDPAYCARNANFLSKTIWYKVRSKTYQPIPALKFLVPKPSGDTREIMAFSIPDAALANVILWRARNRNLKRLSPFSYAYHPERNVFDAILALAGFITEEKLFAVQIDFKNYFDSIPTGYLRNCINDQHMVSLTPDERFILNELMYHQFATRSEYATGQFKRRVKGTPQGCSASLLLANLANHHLDKVINR